jgi:hypothetical protein
MFASAIPTLPWVRLFPFAAILVLAAVTFACWGFLAWLSGIGFRDTARPLERKSPTRGEEDPLADAR